MEKERMQNQHKGLIYININDLVPYQNNPRLNDKAVDAVAASIKEFGFKVPIIVDKDNVIVAGHTRLKAAQKLGIEEVPVIVADDLTDEQIKAFRIADNKVAELAEWDMTRLEMELAELDFDMSEFNFSALAEQMLTEGKELDLDDIKDEIELKIKLPKNQYDAVVEKLRFYNTDLALAIVEALDV